jgi:hypothetical protein
MFLQDMLESAGDEKRLKEIQEKIESEMKKQDIPADISVADFVRRPDPQFEQQRQEVSPAWRRPRARPVGPAVARYRLRKRLSKCPILISTSSAALEIVYGARFHLTLQP